MVWPYPKRDETDGYLDYVYYGPLVLPMAVTVSGDAPKAEIFATLGICSEICVPAQAHFSLPLDDAEPDRPNGLRIRQALAMAPMARDGKTTPIGSVRYHNADRMLAIELGDAALDPVSLIAATASGEPLFGTPQKARNPT
ncbi:protein-disulfide reductase DsbD family protein [Devosia sp. A8/3-2]|nr:protein-disulfide reductase DsbD family protein [Devosia sp. A8/3-2]